MGDKIDKGVVFGDEGKKRNKSVKRRKRIDGDT